MVDIAMRMGEIYKVLHHLREFKVDRQYPYDFQSLINVKPGNKAELTPTMDTPHPQSLQYTELTPEDVLIIPTIPRGYGYIDTLEVKLSTTTPDLAVDPEKVTAGFHDMTSDKTPLITIQGTGTTIPTNKTGRITFPINMASLDPQSHNLTGIKAISLTFEQEPETITITDLVFRSQNPVCTLEELNDSITLGEKYMTDSVELEEVPTPLLDYKYMAAAALLWLGKWEHESHVMTDGHVQSRNYADRLLGIVDRAVNNYGRSRDEDEGVTLVNARLIGHTVL